MYSFKRIFFYTRPHIKKHWVSFLLIFLGYGTGVLLDSILKPYLYKEIIDLLVSNSSHELIFNQSLSIILILILTIIIYNIGYRVGDYASVFFQSTLMKELYDVSLERILKHSYHFFSNTFSGSLVAKIKRFSKQFETFMDVLSYQIWFSFVGLTGVIIILFLNAPLIAWIFLVWVFIYILITFLFIRKKNLLDTIEANADSDVTASLSDIISNFINVKIFSGSKKEVENFKDVTNDEKIKRDKAWNFANLQNVVQAGLMGILQITILILMIKLYGQNKISIGTFVLIQSYMVGLFDILWNLGRSLTRAMKALADMQEVVLIFDADLDTKDPINPEISRMQKGAIAFNSVRFEYQGEVEVFNDFNFNIASGERIGLVGKSGSGKTTITKLILRFMDIHGGEITIDGQDIRKVTQDDLRKAVSYVPQEPILFHRTIRENIAYGKTDATLEEVIEAAKKAHAHEFISSFAHGYDTFVGERGVKLSGGERQRVAIARAILKNAPILILDEATSALDSVSESYIQIALEELMKGKTVIVIAHRLSTIQKMDRIIVLDHGEIKEEGTHKELLEKNGIYRELWDHQSGGFLSE